MTDGVSFREVHFSHLLLLSESYITNKVLVIMSIFLLLIHQLIFFSHLEYLTHFEAHQFVITDLFSLFLFSSESMCYLLE